MQGFYCAGGFSGHGFMHAPATGIIMSSLIAGERPPIDIKELSPGRFCNHALPETIIF